MTPENEAMLRNPQVVLDSALTNADDDPTPAVEKVRVVGLCFRDEEVLQSFH